MIWNKVMYSHYQQVIFPSEPGDWGQRGSLLTIQFPGPHPIILHQNTWNVSLELSFNKLSWVIFKHSQL